MTTKLKRLQKCVVESLPSTYKTCIWLLKIMLPISLGVRILDYYGFIEYLSTYLHPLFDLIGLPGRLAIVFVTSIFVPLYGTIAVMASLSMTLRDATILSIMCLVAHNLFVECAVTKKTGSSFFGMIALRIGMAFVVAYVLNKILPIDNSLFLLSKNIESYNGLKDVFISWFYSSLQLTFILVVIVASLMILQRILIEFNMIEKISKPLVPLMRIFGLPDNAPFLWIVGNVVGLAYGGAVMVDMIEEGKITKEDANLVNYHLSISHSLLEDTVLFVALGINVWVIIISRISFAIIVVWTKRFFVYAKTKMLASR